VDDFQVLFQRVRPKPCSSCSNRSTSTRLAMMPIGLLISWATPANQRPERGKFFRLNDLPLGLFQLDVGQLQFARLLGQLAIEASPCVACRPYPFARSPRKVATRKRKVIRKRVIRATRWSGIPDSRTSHTERRRLRLQSAPYPGQSNTHAAPPADNRQIKAAFDLSKT